MGQTDKTARWTNSYSFDKNCLANLRKICLWQLSLLLNYQQSSRAWIASTHTFVDDWSKDGVVIDRAAVPSPMSELPLALVDRHASAVADAGHVVRVELAELDLTRRQSARSQTLRSQRRAAQNVQLMTAAAPNVSAVHAEVPAVPVIHCIALHFYRAMHFSAKRGIAIACRLSVCL